MAWTGRRVAKAVGAVLVGNIGRRSRGLDWLEPTYRVATTTLREPVGETLETTQPRERARKKNRGKRSRLRPGPD